MSEDEKLLKEAKKLPWEDRLTHKNWKVRNDANIDLAAVCEGISDPKDPRLREFGPFFRKIVADSNAPVQEKALDALIAYLRAADADAGRYAKEVCDAIVAKCLTGRPKTVEKAQMAFMLWVELEAVEAFLDAMEKAIKNKVAKAVVPAMDVMFQALSEFGSKIIPPKRILKMLPELFDHQDQNVRASSKGLTLELCRWIGKDPVKSILFEKMRDTMKKELEAEVANVTGTAKPTRKIRAEQDKDPEPEAVSQTVGTVPAEESVADVPQEIDEYELVDPVDILTPLEKSGFWEGVMQSSENKIESTNELVESDERVLNFMDSMDSFLIIMDSLSSALRQGWLDLASARHSMGVSRLNSTLFDLKPHHASTTLQVECADTNTELPHFTLCKWASSDDDPENCSDEAKYEEDELLQQKSGSPRVQHQELQERKAEGGESPVSADNHAKKARFRSLSMFGALVSPKLRATQLSFETALETLVEISNVRASMLRAYDQVQKDLKAAK